MYLDARRGKAIVASQDKLVIQSEILLSAFAEVGIVALVDEASGFQYDRKLHKSFINSHLNEVNFKIVMIYWQSEPKLYCILLNAQYASLILLFFS